MKKTDKKPAKLTPRQEQFCREYLVDLNATQAAIRAGYSQKTAYSIGHENLKKPEVVKLLSELKHESIERVRNKDELEICADATLREMNMMSRSCIEDFFDIDENGKPTLNLKKAQKRGLLGNIKKIRIKECPPIKVVEAGIEIEREVLFTEVEFWDKVRAGENMMKNQGSLKEKVEVAGMNDLIAALHKGRERVAKLREEREREARRKNDPSA